MTEKFETFFDDMIRPSLAAHGGFVEIVEYSEKKLSLKLSGGCQGCSSSSATLKDGIERLLIQNFPDDVTEVIDLTDHATGENPFFTEES